MATWKGTLSHNNHCLLPDLKISNSLLRISYGLMFASRRKIRNGLCMVFPSTKDIRHGASVTMFFVWFPLEVLFVDSSFTVVDKVTLKPWVPSYTPRAACSYVIEASPGTFSSVNIGDRVKIKGL